MSSPRRIKFIPAMQEFIMKNLMKQGLREDQVEKALKLWNSNAEPETVGEQAMFHVFRDIQTDLEQKEKVH